MTAVIGSYWQVYGIVKGNRGINLVLIGYLVLQLCGIYQRSAAAKLFGNVFQ